jgi:hypothetical protein
MFCLFLEDQWPTAVIGALLVPTPSAHSDLPRQLFQVVVVVVVVAVVVERMVAQSKLAYLETQCVERRATAPPVASILK